MKRSLLLLGVLCLTLSLSCNKQNTEEDELEQWSVLKAELSEKAFIGIAFFDNKINYVDREVKMNNIVGGLQSILQGGPMFVNYQEVIPGKISYSYKNLKGELSIKKGETYTIFVNSNCINAIKDNYLTDYVDMNTLRWFYAEDKSDLKKYKLELNIDNEWIAFDYGKIFPVKKSFYDNTSLNGVRIYKNDTAKTFVREFSFQEFGYPLSVFRKDITFELREFPGTDVEVRLIPLDHFYYSGNLENRAKYF